MNLELDRDQRQLADAVRKGGQAVPPGGSGWEVLRHAGVTAALADGGLVEWCLALEELGAGCHDITTVRAGLAFLDAHPGEQLPDDMTAAAAPATTDRDLLLCAAYAVGLGRACLEAAQNRAADRVITGRRQIEYQGTSHRLAEAALDLALARIAVWHAAWYEDQGRPDGHAAPAAAGASVEAALTCAHTLVQAYGAAGTSDPDVVRLYRGAYALTELCGSPRVLWRTAGERWLATV
ncbi:acyl-CoA dehydrogenase family protein [Streptomyces sp. BRA346]|uniref:acyl-CoA dehydrogenase family protein n=1 Tax=Streptomyces sp. BRA346 TaxID=2878199 RepID=UPI004062874F